MAKPDKQNMSTLLAGETIDYIATEWSDDESCHGIAAQYDSNGILRCSESLAQIEWEQGSKKVEGKVQQEIGCHHASHSLHSVVSLYSLTYTYMFYR